MHILSLWKKINIHCCLQLDLRDPDLDCFGVADVMPPWAPADAVELPWALIVDEAVLWGLPLVCVITGFSSNLKTNNEHTTTEVLKS